MYKFIAYYFLEGTNQIKLTDGAIPQRCRFCGRSSPDVRFKKIAHAISHMIGNKVLKSSYECDSCNEIFGRYESEFSNYMNLYHTMFQVEGKGGFPKFKRNPHDFSKIQVEEKDIRIQIREDEESLIEWGELDKELKQIKIKGKRSYTPEFVLKALVKMAITIAPAEEIPLLEDSIKWLMGEPMAGKLPGIYLRIYQIPVKCPSCYLLKKTERYYFKRPTYFFVLAYRNIVIQVPIPFVISDRHRRPQVLQYPYFPAIQDIIATPYSQRVIDLSGTEKVRGEEVSLKFSYSKAKPSYLTGQSS